ncbi:SapB/AmfS family lanthipeptide [Micromonospora sp. NPDC023956]
MTPHILDLQTLVTEEHTDGLDSNVSVLTCPPCPSTPSLIICC